MKFRWCFVKGINLDIVYYLNILQIQGIDIGIRENSYLLVMLNYPTTGRNSFLQDANLFPTYSDF